jgi:ribosome biogenesis GTPase / thiamine phosphate phosphatase
MATSRRNVGPMDEDDVRARPNPRGSRPRSKQRPSHDEAADGMVVTVDRGRYTVLVGDTEVNAMRARELGRKAVAVGDQVSVIGEISDDPDALVRIVRIGERKTVLRRTADDSDPYERVIVANADQLVVVASLADPPPSFGLIDRAIVAALTSRLEPLLCLTKSDLVASADDVIERYRPIDVRIVITRRDGDLSELRHRLNGHVSVLVGHSGVGKSTLVNLLVPDADRTTAVVGAGGRGRHTSVSAIALRLPEGAGWVIDTPGVRSFGLAHVGAEDLLWAFPDLEDGATQCPPGCDHQSRETGCQLDAWVEAGNSSPQRLAAFRRLLASRSAPPD